MFNWMKKNLSPKRKITAIVVAVVDALQEQYELEVVTTVVDGEIRNRIKFVEKPAEFDDIDDPEVCK